MNDMEIVRPFQPQSTDTAGVLSWIHIGDLHMTKSSYQNDLDLQRIVAEINAVFASSISFVFLPGDVADNGSLAAYLVVRRSLDRLRAPWCAIIGDHDVHEKSFANYLQAMSPQTRYAFTVGTVRFVAMNAFDIPHPGSFTISDDQLAWVEKELAAATSEGQTKVLLLHCYPSDLKIGREPLTKLVDKYNVLLIDMGHTHYNEIANDGRTLYTATRSTGQIEEGPVGFSITNIDGNVASWRFVELNDLPVVMITSPGDERLSVANSPTSPTSLNVRAKIWSQGNIAEVNATLGSTSAQLHRIGDSQVWEGVLDTAHLANDLASLQVTARDSDSNTASDEIRLAFGARHSQTRADRDQENSLEAWPEHGLLGTQLGPNKNGKKW